MSVVAWWMLVFGMVLGAVAGAGIARRWNWVLQRLPWRPEEVESTSREERRDDALRALVDGDENGELEEESIEMIEGIVELGDTRAREVMVPRIDVVGIPLESTLDEALEVIIRCGHSRIPVYSETIDHVEGILYAKDLLAPLGQRRFDVELASVIRPATFVPETKAADALLQELQASRVHLAVVVDEHGGTAGLVTIEDIIEEIVGEIHDEFDALEPDVISVDAKRGKGVFRSGVDIDDVNRLLDLDLPADDDVDTVGGLVFTQLGRVPEAGECAVFGDVEIEVLGVDGRRILTVGVRKTDGAAPGGEPGASASDPGATRAATGGDPEDRTGRATDANAQHQGSG